MPLKFRNNHGGPTFVKVYYVSGYLLNSGTISTPIPMFPYEVNSEPYNNDLISSPGAFYTYKTNFLAFALPT
jgi:hypothetical protein